MDDDTLSLGTETAPWMIKEFSVALRQQITQAARRQGCTVADWLHGHFQKHGPDGQQFTPVKLASVNPAAAPAQGRPDSAQSVSTLVEAACRLAATKGVAKGVRTVANQTLARQLASYSLALPAPD